MILAQILIAMVVTTILSTAVIQRADIRNRTVEADNTVKEINLITEAAQKYRNDDDNGNVWPDEPLCRGAIAELRRPSSNTYLVNIDATSPFRQMPYKTSCDTVRDTFTVEVTSDDVFAGYINTLLIDSTLTGTATTVVTVATEPSIEQSLLDRFLSLGVGTDIYDVGVNTIQQNGRNLLFIAQYTIDVTATTPQEFVPMPDCNSGGIQNDSKVHLSMGTQVAAANEKPIIGWNIFINETDTVNRRWGLGAEIITEDSDKDIPATLLPFAGTLVVAQTYCDTS